MVGIEVEVEEEGEVEEEEQEREEMVDVVVTKLGVRIIREVVEEVQGQVIMEEEEQAIIIKIMDKVTLKGKNLIFN